MAEDLSSSMRTELQRRVGRLIGRPFDALTTLPAVWIDRAHVDGTAVEFTTYCEAQPDGGVLVLVRSDVRRLFSLVMEGSTEGFFAWPDGRHCEADDQVILDFFA
jgi:hypothetical protein